MRKAEKRGVLFRLEFSLARVLKGSPNGIGDGSDDSSREGGAHAKRCYGLWKSSGGTANTLHHPGSTYWMERRDEAWRHINRYLKENPQR